MASGLVRMCGWRGVRERERPYDRALQLGLDRLSAVCALAGVTGPRGVHDLVWDWCAHKPLHDWPLVFDADAQVGGELLLIGGEPSEFCVEWAVEAYDVVAEVHESTLVSQVKSGAEQAGRPDLYAEWRRFVTTQPVLGAAEFLSAKNRFLTVPQWATWIDESYEPVPPATTSGGQVAVCGLCDQWMTPTSGGGWHCETPRCVRALHMPSPTLRDAEGAYRLRPELVRSVALPGRPELALAQALAARGARVVLYPGLDALDLVARWPDGYAVGVDVKDWHKPYLLARKIKRFPRWETGHPFAYGDAFLVVPADRVARNRSYCDIVRRRSAALRSQPHIEVLTDQALISRCPDAGQPGEVVCGP
ncbi:pPIWI_RE_Y domain-containing protein [Prauserella endophytica]|uniref:pPIWI_RE_Y domain-containing protein n=1 Tax=Prauserella endophytica TaxID=1592324 RepID=UPI001E479328|nr:hypothetical protein [Prauserella endophytica]